MSVCPSTVGRGPKSFLCGVELQLSVPLWRVPLLFLHDILLTTTADFYALDIHTLLGEGSGWPMIVQT